jgi:hydroxyacylglutathione hydrolase
MARTALSLTVWIALGLWIVHGSAAWASSPTQARRPTTPPDWFHVYEIAAHTYAISEPKYWQQNVSYLLIGTRRALLFDTGPGLYSIRAQVDRLTSLPVIVIPSHLHFDHVGDVEEFGDVRLPDLPVLRAQVHNGYFVEAIQQYMLRDVSFRFRVHGFVRDAGTIDLGERAVRLLFTPGHTPDSVSIVDADGARLFTGDLVNRVATLFAVPGSNVRAAASSLRRLLIIGHPGSLIYEAHAEAPLRWPELQQLAGGIQEIAAGRGGASTRICLDATPMRRFTVGPFPLLLPLEGGVAQAPLRSATEVLDFGGNACD